MLQGCEEHQTAALRTEKKAACQTQYLPLSLSFLYSHTTTSKCPCQDLKTFWAQSRETSFKKKIKQHYLKNSKNFL